MESEAILLEAESLTVVTMAARNRSWCWSLDRLLGFCDGRHGDLARRRGLDALASRQLSVVVVLHFCDTPNLTRYGRF